MAGLILLACFGNNEADWRINEVKTGGHSPARDARQLCARYKRLEGAIAV
jgi:hypothetical protein